jgi:hypothetical protein
VGLIYIDACLLIYRVERHACRGEQIAEIMAVPQTHALASRHW